MSCDRLARDAIATLGMDLTPEARARLPAVYDQPPRLQPGEVRADLTLAAQALVLRLKATGAAIPEHLNLDSPRSRAAIRFGRLALALSAAEREPQAESAPLPPVDQGEGGPGVPRSLRAALAADPLLEDEVEADEIGFTISDLVARADALAARLAALPADALPPPVRAALAEIAEVAADAMRLRDQGAGASFLASMRTSAAHALVKATAQAAAPREPDPRFPVGTWVTVGPPSSHWSLRVPEGSVGRIQSWENGHAIIAFELPLTMERGNTFLRDESEASRRSISVGYLPHLLTGLPGEEGRSRAAALPHPEDRALALAQVIGGHLTPQERQQALAVALTAVDALDDDEYAAIPALAAIIQAGRHGPGMDEAARQRIIRAATPRYVRMLRALDDDILMQQEVPTIALLDRAAQDALLTVARGFEPFECAEVLVTLGRLAERPELLEEARVLLPEIPEVWGHEGGAAHGGPRGYVQALLEGRDLDEEPA